MPLEASFVTTSGLPERGRFPFWRETARKLFGVDTLPVSRRPFSAELATTWIKGFAFSRLRCLGQECRTTPRSVHRNQGELLILSIMLRGHGRGLQDGREIQAGPGELVFLDTARPHVGTLDDDYEGLFVCVPRQLWIRTVGPTEHITARVIRSDTQVGRLVFNFFRQIIPDIGNMKPTTAHRLAEASLALLRTLADSLSQEIPHSSLRASLLCRAKTLIEENLHDPSLSPEKVARRLRISTRYLRHLFQEDGTTVSNWMWSRRVERCRNRLSDPLLAGQSISEIAIGCGFSDFSHFGRRFKAAFSMSPSEFRREQQAIKRS